jgi:uncharacterized cupredoxin-like copper-binding protein
MHIRVPLVAAMLVLAGGAAAGCGDDDGQGSTAEKPSTSSAPTTTGSKPADAHRLTVGMTEFAFQPKNATAGTGKVVIAARNDGRAVHELVLLRTDQNPAKLPKKGGKVDESTSVGEISDVAPGATKRTTFDLKPGKYAMVCALPGHYEGGMYGSLTAK